MNRQTGRTTEQIVKAPQGAVFVCMGPSDYTKRLADSLGRKDLRIITQNSLPEAIIGIDRPLVVDHAVQPNELQYVAIRLHQQRYPQ